jgi:hypothetical protein
VGALALVVGIGLVIAGVALAIVGYNWPDPSRLGIINTPGEGYLFGGLGLVIFGWGVIGFALKDIEGLNWIGGCFVYAFLGPVSALMYAFGAVVCAVGAVAVGSWALAAWAAVFAILPAGYCFFLARQRLRDWKGKAK